MNKKISLALVFIMIISISSPVLASSKYDNAGESLKYLNVLNGDENGNLMLDKNFKRQDMVIMISRLYNEEQTAKSYKANNVFKDLTASRKFYIPYVAWAKDKGLIKGMEVDEFGFGLDVVTQQFQTVLLRALGYEDEASEWNKVPDYATNLNIMNSVDATANSKLTRGQMAQMVMNALSVKVNGEDITLSDKLAVDIPEEFRANHTIDKDTFHLKGVAEKTENLNITIRPTSSNITTGSKTHKIDLDKEGYFEFKLEDLLKGSYEYRLEGDKNNTQFFPFEIKDESFELINITSNNLKEISINFSKPLDVKDASYTEAYKTDAGVINYVDFANEGKTAILKLKNNMTQGKEYKVTINKVKSASGSTFSVKDEKFKASGSASPKVSAHAGFKNYITITFNKELDESTLSNYSNYYINLDDQLIHLPGASKITTSNDNKVVEIVLPETFAGKDVVAGKNLKAIQLVGFKDIEGNDTDPLLVNLKFTETSSNKPQAINYNDNVVNRQGTMVDKETLKVKFNVPIIDASPSDFSSYTSGIEIEDVIADGSNIVTLEIYNKYGYTTIPDRSITIKSNNNIETSLKTNVESQSLSFIDTIAPEVESDISGLTYDRSTVYIPFTEELEREGAGLYRRDLEVTKNGVVLSDSEVTTSLDNNYGSDLRVNISNFDSRADYEISLKGKQNGKISYIKDIHGNLALPAGPFKVKY